VKKNNNPLFFIASMQNAFAQTDSIDIKLQPILAEKNAAIRIDSSNNLIYGGYGKVGGEK
jgi:hypothetical protein